MKATLTVLAVLAFILGGSYLASCAGAQRWLTPREWAWWPWNVSRKPVRNEEALAVVDDYLRWLGPDEFPEVHRVLSNLQAKLSGEPLNAGTPGLVDNCVIDSLRAQLRRRRSDQYLHLRPGEDAVPLFDMLQHLARQRAFSERTFGPGMRTQGVVDHIRKELIEILADPADLSEWIDVAILALDGAWRTGAAPEQIIAALVAKQTKNEGRNWPDWRTAPADRAIEHVRHEPESLDTSEREAAS
jgi:hypothetical protein